MFKIGLRRGRGTSSTGPSPLERSTLHPRFRLGAAGSAPVLIYLAASTALSLFHAFTLSMDATIGMNASVEPYLDPMLWRQLRGVLQHLQGNHYPPVTNPPSCKKRASVALIIRFRPASPASATFLPASGGTAVSTKEQRLDHFFAQQWVQQGEPEVLFIKRASRSGDRWTGHIAFPGGGREDKDEDDCATSVRETQEEIGLDLNADHCMLVGNLPEQVVTTWWSKVPLMVLCPYVHLVMRPDIPPLSLQPTEVHSAHWVSLRALMSPHLRTFERSDVSDRFFRRGNAVIKRMLRVTAGQLLFTAKTLVSAESLYSRAISDYQSHERPLSPQMNGLTAAFLDWWSRPPPTITTLQPPLILWGLTYGIMANFLALLPNDDPSKMWDWPTLSPWDMRLVIWATTYRFRAQKMKALGQPANALGTTEGQQDGVDLGGLDRTTFTTADISGQRKNTRSSVDTMWQMLDGYFERVRIAVWIALALRLGFGTLLTTLVIRRYRRRRRYMAHG